MGIGITLNENEATAFNDTIEKMEKREQTPFLF